MNDEHKNNNKSDEDILELTRDMISSPPPPPESEEKIIDSVDSDESLASQQSESKVIMTPIRNISKDVTAEKTSDKTHEDNKEEQEKDKNEDEVDEVETDEDKDEEKVEVDEVEADEDEEVLELGEEMIAPEDSKDKDEVDEDEDEVDEDKDEEKVEVDEVDADEIEVIEEDEEKKDETDDTTVDADDDLFEKVEDEKKPEDSKDEDIEIDVDEDIDEDEEIELNDDEIVTLQSESDSIKIPSDTHGKIRSPRLYRRRKKRTQWWSKIFNDDFLAVQPDLTDRDLRRETDFIENCLNVSKSSLVLDLACGEGRQAINLAKRGYRMVGVDLSLTMLARAGEEAQKKEVKINFIHGDMRELGFEQTFDAVYCVGTSFGYFDETTNVKVVEGIYNALKPGGKFLILVANRDNAIVGQPNLTWFEGKDCICMEETDFNYINSRLYSTRQIIMDKIGRQVNHDFSIRLYSLHELGLMLHNCGFSVKSVSGHYATPGAFFGADSANIIILAER